MQNKQYDVTGDRFSLADPNLYLLEGMIPEQAELSAYVDGKLTEISIHALRNISVLDEAGSLDALKGSVITAAVPITNQVEHGKKLTVYTESKGEKTLWYTAWVKEILKKRGEIPYFLEEVSVQADKHVLVMQGWAVDTTPVKITLVDPFGNPVKCTFEKLRRPDLVELYDECSIEMESGFYLAAHDVTEAEYQLVFQSETRTTVHPISMKKSKIVAGKISRYYHKGMDYLKSYGLKEFLKKVKRKARDKKSGVAVYSKWQPKHAPTEAELKRQRKESLPINPKFSVVVPLYKTHLLYLKELIESLQNQTYSNWELCFSDGSGADSPLTEFLQQEAAKDERIKVAYAEEQLRIAENTNRAIEMATGDFIAFADHDDMLREDAFYEVVQSLLKHPEAEMVYTDEDKMTVRGHYIDPHFKPDFNPDLLRTVNYICHLVVVKRELLDQVGLLDPAFDGAQDYDFILRCSEKAREIAHVQKAVYHWRCHEDSTAENPESKQYAFEAGKRAIEAHYKRLGIPATVEAGEYMGLYRTYYHWDHKPLISIMIPNKDHIDDLDRCIQSIESKSKYENYEYIIIENNSTEESTFEYYKKLEAENPRAHVIYYEGKFNYSAINNFGAKHAKGEYLWLLNNDTSIINGTVMEEMVGYCMREDVGIVGARLYYEDDTIQHAGVVIGFGGIAGHCFVQQPKGASGYHHRIIEAQDYSAVTAACMMVKRSVFDAVDGMTEELEVAFNDIDFCMKVRALGKLVVYNPYAELHHYESKSRGLEDTPEKIARFQKEIATFERRWPDILKNGDPYYNPNLTLESQDFSLRRD